ncbi:protein unc-13 homolog [Zingiber officinale]|uniref:Uncharacterized protein n=1 Tax=Zingiber officinale TaxID=94328 RepID=A0A8J5L4M0_ZINOF|nr:protein unc-13 homolog [Zingiber officinale]KAG6500681.1 hypothetical protein ZIOFF_040531 [Zingiber officinale]
MGSRLRRQSTISGGFSPPSGEAEEEDGGVIQWPFGRLDTLGQDEIKETAYELFFACSRSSSVASGLRGAAARHSIDGAEAAAKAGSSASTSSAMSRVKEVLGLKARPAASIRTTLATSAATLPLPGKAKQRSMTSAEIMRMQMGFEEQTDFRLRKILMRFLVGQVSKQVESIILPLEFLRHLKPTEFSDIHEYHRWQRRQLKVLEAGLLLHPSLPSDRLYSAGLRFREILTTSEFRPIDTSKHSEVMRSLCNCIMALAWCHQSVAAVEECHWADGFPLNVHLYLCLLRSIFDIKEETVVLEEVDELLELIKRTWTTLGINKMIHEVCFTWIFFEQYIMTGLVEPDLMHATLAMLDEVAIDAMKPDKEPSYTRVLIPTMTSLKVWAEKQLLDYHECFEKDSVTTMESVLCLALSTAKIMIEISSYGSPGMIFKDFRNFSTKIHVDQYIRSSLKSAFTKLHENGNGKIDSMVVEVDEDPNDTLINLMEEIEKLASVEKENYSPLLKRWHPVPAAVAAVTLHRCFGAVLNQHMYKFSCLSNESVKVLQTAANLERLLIQMAMEDSAGSEDGGKEILSEIASYGVDTILFNLLKHWVDDRLRIGRECVNRARDSESWNPMSKSEPYAESGIDLLKLAKVTVDEFFEIEGAAKTELAQDLAVGLDTLFKDYSMFAASCGSKESYVLAHPPLTRCNQDSRVAQFWKKAAAPCNAGVVAIDPSSFPIPRAAHTSGDAHRHTASRTTQRLYVRLNTLHHILALLQSFEKSFAATSYSPPFSHFDGARSSINTVILHVVEVAAYRLIFLDSAHFFYDSLYLGSVVGARIDAALRAMTHNMAHLATVLSERALATIQPVVMRATLEAFLMVLLAGGPGRAFARGDYDMVAKDLACLKRMFSPACGEEVVSEAAAMADGVVALMAMPTEKLVEEFSIAACEARGLGRSLERVPMPAATGKWHRADPYTMLRVLCHRNDDVANRFLKRTFQLPKRR